MQACKHANMQANKQASKQTSKQADKQTNDSGLAVADKPHSSLQ
jgi:hypothetical protein